MRKSKAKSKFHTRHALALMLGKDRGTIERAAASVTPGAIVKGRPLYRRETIEAALEAARQKRAGWSALKDARTEQEVRRLKNYNDRKESQFVLRSVVDEALAKTIAEIEPILERRFCVEWPAMIHGLDLTGIRVKSMAMVDTIRADLRSMVKHWNF